MTILASPVRLKRYPPGYSQSPHEHGIAHLSLLVAGGFEEVISGRSTGIEAGRVGLRPEGLRHAVTFGAGGAVVLTCVVPAHRAGHSAVREMAWSPVLPLSHLRRLTPLLLEGRDEACEAIWDLLALAIPAPPPVRMDPWLKAVRDALLEAPAETRLSDIAASSGRHRVHVGRAFLAAYGEAPSVFRRRAMLDRALSLSAAGLSQASAAIEAGFADQSHFTRACRSVWGLPPGRLIRHAA